MSIPAADSWIAERNCLLFNLSETTRSSIVATT
nr:MAG TPA: hypothetical protein [Caudoviricetes sp.]